MRSWIVNNISVLQKKKKKKKGVFIWKTFCVPHEIKRPFNINVYKNEAKSSSCRVRYEKKKKISLNPNINKNYADFNFEKTNEKKNYRI